jgi:tetratricopeptide (TPR) repeat protein
MPALLVAACLGIAPAIAASPSSGPGAATHNLQAVETDHLFGQYLAGRHAQQSRDFAVAASRYEKAIALDPDSPELISRTFLMEVCVGHFERARALAQKELKLDPGDAVAELVLVVDRLKAGDPAGALKQAATLPTDGVHRFIAPFALAWTRKAAGDLAGADGALQGLDKFNGFQPLKAFQLGLLYDYAGKPDKAQQYFAKALDANEQLNWRLTDAIANFDERHGRAAEAKALYDRFIQQNTSGDLAMSVSALRAPGPPQPTIRAPADGLAEAMFDLASVLNQAETIDLSLLYVRLPSRCGRNSRSPSCSWPTSSARRTSPSKALPSCRKSRRVRPTPGPRGCAARSTSTPSSTPRRRSPSSRRWRRKTPG